MRDYLYIRAWGNFLGSMNYYIDIEVEEARKDNAPQNAIYKKDEDKPIWQTIDDISIESTKQDIENIVARMS